MNHIDFLKKYSSVSNEFIDDFFGMYDINTKQTDIVIDLEKVVKWLNAVKGNLKETLKRSYKFGIDYTVMRVKKKKGEGSGATIKELILISPDTFKLLCMQSNAKKGKEVRQYYLSIENLLIKYREYIIQGLNDKIKALENNQKPKINPTKGILYILRADDNHDDVFKIGKSKKLKNRLKSYNSGRANDIEVLHIYECDDIGRVETCVKNAMKQFQYRNYKEVYQVNINIIKDAMNDCGDLIAKYKKPNVVLNKDSNLYVVIKKKKNTKKLTK